MSVRKPDLGSFLDSMNLQVSRYLLKKVDSKRHEIKFVTPAHAPFRIPTMEDIHLNNVVDPKRSHRDLVYRHISFSDVGILCSSATRPSLREITLRAEIEAKRSIKCGPRHTLRCDFKGEEEQFGSGRTYCSRHDFAKREDHMDKRSELLVLEPGMVHHPFWMGGTGLYQAELARKYERKLGSETVLSSEEIGAVEADFEGMAGMLAVDVIAVPASCWLSTGTTTMRNLRTTSLTRVLCLVEDDLVDGSGWGG